MDKPRRKSSRQVLKPTDGSNNLGEIVFTRDTPRGKAAMEELNRILVAEWPDLLRFYEDPNLQHLRLVVLDEVQRRSAFLKRLDLLSSDTPGQTELSAPHQLGSAQIERIAKSLDGLPAEKGAERIAALEALRTLHALIEVQGARIVQANAAILLDEFGKPRMD